MARWLFIAFLIAHGFIHLAIWVVPRPKDTRTPFDPTHSWLLGDSRGLTVALATTAAVLFVTAGLGLAAEASWARPLAVATSGISLALMLLTFNPWLLAGIGIDVVMIVGLGSLDWPSVATLGA